MAFPIETEANIRRRMLDLCQTHARNVVEITRQLVVLMDNIAEKKPKLAKENYEAMLKALEDNEKNKATFLVKLPQSEPYSLTERISCACSFGLVRWLNIARQWVQADGRC